MKATLLLACSVFAGSACDAAAPDFSRTPVLFVHGAGVSSGVWDHMLSAFEADGYPPEYLMAVDLEPSSGDNRRAAEVVLKPAVEALLRVSAAANPGAGSSSEGKIDIVAHSMGAASGRWYATKIGPEFVRVLLAIAGTNFGSDAVCDLSGEGARQMCPAYAADQARNPFQVALNGTPSTPADPTPFGVGIDRDGVSRVPPDAERSILYATIRIERDRWVVPASSAMLPGSGGFEMEGPMPYVVETSPGNFLYTADATHDGMLRDRRVWGLVLAILRAADE